MTITTTNEQHLPAIADDGALPTWVRLIEPVAILSESLARTEFVPKALRGRPEAVAACILWGVEVNIGPMQALDGIDVVDGTPTPSAELMRALVLRAGHDIWAVEASSNAVTMAGRRKGSTATTQITWTMSDARTAGLLNRDAWRKYPRAMLANRATTELCRLMFPDVLAGLSHDADEVATEPEAVEAPKARARTMRRKAVESAPEPRHDDATQDDAPAPDRAPEPRHEPVTHPDAPAEPEPATSRPEAVPGLEPEQPTDAMSRAMFAHMHEVLPDITREQRLAFTITTVGRVVESSADLTRHEVATVIDTLTQVANGHLRVTWSTDAAGAPVCVLVVPGP